MQGKEGYGSFEKYKWGKKNPHKHDNKYHLLNNSPMQAYNYLYLLLMERLLNIELCHLQDVIGCTQEMDFILWPRNDIEKIVCLLFSRWKGSDEPFRPVQVLFLT